MKNSTKKIGNKHYRFLLHEISSEELNTDYKDLYRFIQIYQTDLIARMTDIYENVEITPLTKYCLDPGLSSTIMKHAVNACKYNRTIADAVDKIKFDWGAKILAADACEDPIIHDSLKPKKVRIKHPIFEEKILDGCKYAEIVDWRTLFFYFDGAKLPENFRPKSKIHFHHQNNRLRIYAVGCYI